MTWYSIIENLKVSTQNLVEVINECNKVAQYKTNIQRSVVYPYNNNKCQREKLRKQSQLISVQQTIKITIIAQKNKIPKNKSNQGGKRLVL